MKKYLGQVFLKDKNIIDKIIKEASQASAGSYPLVEIGCGEGYLSQALAKIATKLYIIEIDEPYFELTKNRLAAYQDKLIMIKADVIKAGFKQIEEERFNIVTNLPYYISAKFIKLIIQNKKRFHLALVMLQKEFAQKLSAKPGRANYTSLSVYANYYLEITPLFKVSKKCFRPIPKVDSMVIKIAPREKPLFEVDEEIFFKITKSAFWARRKTLINCLTNSPYLNLRADFKNDLFFQKYRPNIRGEELSLAEFYELYLALKNYVIIL
jgi:16S rRNA (adenine1518-N6/adenine1519-N6)-dimethyltransferase